MGIGWQMTKGAFGAGRAMNRGVQRAVAGGMATRQVTRTSPAVRAGLVGPFDDIPANASDFRDYSGIATPNDITPMTWSFPLGRYVMPKGTRRNPAQWTGDAEIGIDDRTANRHTVVYTPTQGGKTSSIIAPWIWAGLQYGYVVVTLDMKGNDDLIDHVHRHAASREPLPEHLGLATFDYNKPSGSVSWNWMDDLIDDSAIEAAVEALVGKDRENDPNREFRARDMKWMRALFEFARDSRVTWTVGLLLSLLADHDRMVRVIDHEGSQRVRERLADLIDPRITVGEYHDKIQFLTTYLEVLNHEGFNRVTQRHGMSMDDLGQEPGLMVVSTPLADGKLSAAVGGLFLSQFLNRQLKRFNTSNRPVLFVLDEAPRLQNKLDLPGMLASAASSGMSVLLAVQEINDFDDKQRDAILANCATHILMGGAAPKTTDYFGERLGTRQALRRTIGSTYNHRDGHSLQRGVQSETVPYLGRAELATPPGGLFPAIVQCYALSRKPILVDLTRADLIG
jgi:TraM recognition site of TraD and TraG